MTDVATSRRDDVPADLPPSAKYVIFVLEESGGSITRSQLQERTDLADRTPDRALDRFESVGIVRRDRDADDLRFVRIEFDASVDTLRE
ncbi:MarR family transcriptional regulator [Halosolutus halophilus]|uniref:MarR family transcriptional regulator n=1 Tax=Halosolutus halophilus TaxID=1552990 RepID=UPI0022350BD0|nr:MarR family transcriptional regulator [Halosolutus halophilus]